MHSSHRGFTLLIVALVVWGCGSSESTPSPTQLPGPAASVAAPTTSPERPQEPSPAEMVPIDPFLNAVVVTVSDRLRVRSEPRVSDDSIRYEPVLPIGTELRVLDGPIRASGYTWYEVLPVSFSGLEGPGHGWVAMAGKDGEPWIALADRPVGGAELAMADVPRAAAEPADAMAAAGSINAFGLDLYGAVLTDPELDLGDKNVVLSPASIALALAMVRAGARGDTATEMDAVLRTAGWDDLGPDLNSLDQALASRNSSGSVNDGTVDLALRIANTAYGQRNWTIEQRYLDEIAAAFGAGLRLVDFAADLAAARKTINGWVSDQTRRRIPELLGPEDLSPMTRLVLVNAIYLKAEWASQFIESFTEPAPFTGLDGSRTNAPMMHQQATLPYARGTGWKATELRYRGAEGSTPLAMTLVLPDDLLAFERVLTAGQVERITAALDRQTVVSRQSVDCPDTCGCHEYDVSLFMPKFKTETRAKLIPALSNIGMTLPFDPALADFSGIHVPESAEGRIHVSEVIHQANIDVDEKGTEAAAATAVGMDTAGCGGTGPSKVFTVRLDRPFLFFLRDVETGAILFMGRVTDPLAT